MDVLILLVPILLLPIACYHIGCQRMIIKYERIMAKQPPLRYDDAMTLLGPAAVPDNTSVCWSAEDGEWVATNPLYPGVSALAVTPWDAMREFAIAYAAVRDVEQEDAKRTRIDKLRLQLLNTPEQQGGLWEPSE